MPNKRRLNVNSRDCNQQLSKHKQSRRAGTPGKPFNGGEALGRPILRLFANGARAKRDERIETNSSDNRGEE